MTSCESIALQRVGDNVLVEFKVEGSEKPLTLLLQVDVAAKLGMNLVTMSSSLAHDALDDLL